MLHLGTENVRPQRLGRRVRLMPRYVLLADGIELFLNLEVTLKLALGELYHLL